MVTIDCNVEITASCYRLDLRVWITVSLLYKLSPDTATDIDAFTMRSLLKCPALLRQKLFRPACCSHSFVRFYWTDIQFSGPPPTEPSIGEYQPLSSGWNETPEEVIPREVDVAIVGGGLVGLCAAFFIKHRFPRSFTMAVIDKDPLVRFLQ